MKYEITDIAHEQYPFLRRIRALQDIGSEVKAGDLGGFVESAENLSIYPSDTAWVFGNAIACNSACVDQGAVLRGSAIACDMAYVSQGAVLADYARAEDSAYVRGAALEENARICGCGRVLRSSDTQTGPELSGQCIVYGTVRGDVRITGGTVILSGEEIANDAPDTLVIRDGVRSILRDPSRDVLESSHEQPEPEKPKKKEVYR